VSVRDIDRGYKALVRALHASPKYAVEVGILPEDGAVADEDGITLAGYATVNEFGSADGRVPQRSFLRSTVDENREKYLQMTARAAARSLSDSVLAQGDGAVERVLLDELGRLGLRGERDVKRKIRDLRDPPNAPMTIKLKGSSNPLIDTGRMRRNIRSRVSKVSK
jgi:hypothetical protein